MLFITLLLPLFALANPLDKAETLIPNFLQVSTAVYRGGNPMRSVEDKSGLDALKALGVAVVVDLQGKDVDDTAIGWLAGAVQPGEAPENIAEEKRYLESIGIQFVNLPFRSYDSVDEQEGKIIQRAVELLGNASEERPVFVHCEQGKDRTGLVVALHRLQNRGWTVKESYDEWVESGHDIFSWPVTGRLDDYFFELAKRGRFDPGL